MESEKLEVAGVSQTPPHSTRTTMIYRFVPMEEVSERNRSLAPITGCEILSVVPLSEEKPDITPHSDTSQSEMSYGTSSVSSSADKEGEKKTIGLNQKRIVPKYHYASDQWSPLNPEGKKRYAREFLLQLKSQPLSLRKPEDLPNLDVIKYELYKAYLLREKNKEPKTKKPKTKTKKKPSPVLNRGERTNESFTPEYAEAESIVTVSHTPVNQSTEGNGGEKPTKNISSSRCEDENIKLHQYPNPWRPLYKCEIPLNEKDKLKRSVLGVLNKLAPQKFETLLNQIRGLNIDSEEKLALVVNLIFEKAIKEPKFSVPYANLVRHLAVIKVPVSGTSGTKVNFRKLLLTKCQREFEQDMSDEYKLKNDEMIKLFEAADPDKRKEIQLEYEEEEKKFRYRQLGNIRFIGELFKQGCLIEPIVHECIKKLLSQGDEESLECLSVLLKTVGEELDDAGATQNSRDNQMYMYLGQLKLIIDKRLTCSRIRFLLQDVIDLKKNNWVPRKDPNNPETIHQIFQTNLIRRNTGGWTSSSKSNKESYCSVDPTKLKLTKPDEVENIRLGPGGRGLQSWGRGSSGGTKTTADSDKTALTNGKKNYIGKRGFQRSAALSHESDKQLPHADRKTSSASTDGESFLEIVKGLIRTSEDAAPEVKATADLHLNEKAAAAEVFQKESVSNSFLILNKYYIDSTVHQPESNEYYDIEEPSQ